MNTTMKRSIPGTMAAAILGLFQISLAAQTPTCPDQQASLNLKGIGCSSSLASVTFLGGTLTAHGSLVFTNTGKGPANVWNVVANLQERQGGDWVTIASAVANRSAACGSTAKTCPSTSISTSPGATLALTTPLADLLPVPSNYGAICPVFPVKEDFTATFGDPIVLQSRTAMRLEILATHDGSPKGCTLDVDCDGSTTGCSEVGGIKTILVRFGIQVP